MHARRPQDVCSPSPDAHTAGQPGAPLRGWPGVPACAPAAAEGRRAGAGGARRARTLEDEVAAVVDECGCAVALLRRVLALDQAAPDLRPARSTPS
jgi:hypothetical protein